MGVDEDINLPVVDEDINLPVVDEDINLPVVDEDINLPVVDGDINLAAERRPPATPNRMNDILSFHLQPSFFIAPNSAVTKQEVESG